MSAIISHLKSKQEDKAMTLSGGGYPIPRIQFWISLIFIKTNFIIIRFQEHRQARMILGLNLNSAKEKSIWHPTQSKRKIPIVNRSRKHGELLALTIIKHGQFWIGKSPLLIWMANIWFIDLNAAVAIIFINTFDTYKKIHGKALTVNIHLVYHVLNYLAQ